MEQLKKGKQFFEKQQYEEAISILTAFLNKQPTNADALYIRAMSYRKAEKFDNSIADFTTILKRLPDEAALICERGISHFHNKDIEAAMIDMNAAVDLEPENPFRYSSRAYIRAKTDIDGAMADYEKAVALDPKDEIALNNLGLLQENAGKMRAAKNSFKKSNEIIGYDPEKRNKKEGNREEKIDEREKEKVDSLSKTMLSVFTSKQTREEYFQFLKSMFKK